MLELKYELTRTSKFLTTECEDSIKLRKPEKQPSLGTCKSTSTGDEECKE